ncbi:phage terminase large subunit [Burkholderia pseudomallei]|uniref:phage terminase large subunit n=1 Tax=Burkholderia pseudomallei TaxID=28450 RepID=UPI000977967A|nr:phage terminase large subunit [Burkholderia pseudomallei]OMS07808.1 hypothetical protein AQ736_03405 [Burkholderia pseudomallei]OMS96436.1 hypothetical protein AQ750_04685 [Burkholderia pseudomallei]OMV27157.1 hypothetical protein AQ787_14135 [Burkholderia pseudomallei]CAJ3486213.1 phage protein [Burkholderia pseudomallei]CAJ4175250.1 phage protein [Burkholderia pseudomallei]
MAKPASPSKTTRKSAKTQTAANAAAGWVDSNFLAYCIAQDPEYKLATHLRVLADKLQLVAEGKIKRLQIFMPPQYGKSFTAATNFIAWLLGRFPTRSYAYATYNSDFAETRGGLVRDLISSPVHKQLFPNSVLSDSSTAKNKFALTATRDAFAFLGVGRGSGITGNAVSGIIIDDPLKGKEEALSPTIRQSMHGWYNTDVHTRIKPDDFVIIINTRWHEDDLSGYTLREHEAEEWETIVFPAILEDQKTCDLLNSYRTPEEIAAGKKFEVGGSLWPEERPLDFMLRKKAILPAYDWAALYQQSPYAEGGGLIQWSWYRKYSGGFVQPGQLVIPGAPANERPMVVQSWDLANKDKAINDPSACTTWYVYTKCAYLVHSFTKRMTYPVAKKLVVAHAREWGADLVLVEEKANGTALVPDLRAECTIPVLGVDPGNQANKQTRAIQSSSAIEGGQVFIPDADHGWMKDFCAEVCAFPAGKHDDMVDSQTQFLTWFKDRVRSYDLSFRKAGGTRTFGTSRIPGWR